jgi:hypothetical protein
LHNEDFIIRFVIFIKKLKKNISLFRSRRMGWVGHIACMGEMRNAHTILIGKPEGKIPLGRHRHG